MEIFVSSLKNKDGIHWKTLKKSKEKKHYNPITLSILEYIIFDFFLCVYVHTHYVHLYKYW